MILNNKKLKRGFALLLALILSMAGISAPPAALAAGEVRNPVIIGISSAASLRASNSIFGTAGFGDDYIDGLNFKIYDETGDSVNYTRTLISEAAEEEKAWVAEAGNWSFREFIQLTGIDKPDNASAPITAGRYFYKAYAPDAAADASPVSVGGFNVIANEANSNENIFYLFELLFGIYPPKTSVKDADPVVNLINDYYEPMTPIYTAFVQSSGLTRVEYLLIDRYPTNSIGYSYVISSKNYPDWNVFSGTIARTPVFNAGVKYAATSGTNQIKFKENVSVTVKVTKNAADFGVYFKNGNHYAPFTNYQMTKDEAKSDSDGAYDFYTGKIPLNTELHCEATMPGGFKYSERFKLTDANQIKTIDLPEAYPGGNISAWAENSVYTNMNDTGSVELAEGETFDLDTFRVWQAMKGVTENYFIEPEFEFETLGESASIEQTGSPGRLQQRITAGNSPGVSIVKVTYNPIIYSYPNSSSSTTLYHDAIDPVNTGVAVVNVGLNTNDFDTGITARNDFDSYYFDKASSEYAEFSFTPAAGSTVRVHDPLHNTEWGEGWNAAPYTPAQNGEFTVQLKEGRNIIEVTHEGSVKYHVVTARGLDIDITNGTNPGQPPSAGDTVKIKLNGLSLPVQKMSGIYNPGFPDRVWIEYKNASGGTVESNHLQYTFITNNVITYTVPNAGTVSLSGGRIYCEHLGSSLGAHRNIPLTGAGVNMSANTGDNSKYFGALPDIVLFEAPPIDGPTADVTVAAEDGASLTVKSATYGTTAQAGENGVYSLLIGETYSYVYSKQGYYTKTGTFYVAEDTTSFTLPTFGGDDIIPQTSGSVSVIVSGSGSILRTNESVAFDIANVPDLAADGYVEYNNGGYTALHAIIAALNATQSTALGDYGKPVEFTAANGAFTSVGGVTPANGAAWYAEVNGEAVSDYANTIVSGGDVIKLYYAKSGQIFSWFSPDSASVSRGGSAEFTLLGKEAGTDGAGGPVSGAAVAVDGVTVGKTGADGKITLATANLSLDIHSVTAAYGDTLTYNLAALTVTKPAETAENTVSFRLVGAKKHMEEVEPDGYSEDSEYQNWIKTVEYPLTDGNATVYDVFDWALGQAGLGYDESGGYVSGIDIPNAFGGGQLEEKNNGGDSGWMYTINGVHPTDSLLDAAVTAGDEIVWHYVEDFTTEEVSLPRHWLQIEDVPPPMSDNGIILIMPRKELNWSGNALAGDLTVNVKKYSADGETPITGDLIVAIHEEGGKLAAIRIFPGLTITQNDNPIPINEISLPNVAANGYTVKAYLWSSIDKIAPIANAYEYSLLKTGE